MDLKTQIANVAILTDAMKLGRKFSVEIDTNGAFVFTENEKVNLLDSVQWENLRIGNPLLYNIVKESKFNLEMSRKSYEKIMSVARMRIKTTNEKKVSLAEAESKLTSTVAKEMYQHFIKIKPDENEYNTWRKFLSSMHNIDLPELLGHNITNGTFYRANMCYVPLRQFDSHNYTINLPVCVDENYETGLYRIDHPNKMGNSLFYKTQAPALNDAFRFATEEEIIVYTFLRIKIK